MHRESLVQRREGSNGLYSSIGWAVYIAPISKFRSNGRGMEWQILVQWIRKHFLMRAIQRYIKLLGKMYSFSMAAIKSHHKFSSLKQHSFTTSQFYKFGGNLLQSNRELIYITLSLNAPLLFWHSLSNLSENFIGSIHIHNGTISHHLCCHNPGPSSLCLYACMTSVCP